MQNVKKVLQITFVLLCLAHLGYSQAISNHYFGINAWMPDTIGSHVYNGKLHKYWNSIKSSGTTIVRFGGIGTDENIPTNYQYIKMVDSIRAKGMEPILQVPFNNGQYTAQDAAAIVRYVNITKGRKVKYWIIANEPNLSYSYTTAAQVAAYFRPFASAMKSEDPSILIIGPETAAFKKTITDGLTTPGGPDDITGKDASGRFYLDIFSFHTYPMGSGNATRAQLISKLTASGSFEDNLVYLNTRIAAANTYHHRSEATALKTAVTETNVDYTNSTTDNLYGTGANSFMGGQFVAEICGIGLKRGVDFINLWSAIEGNNVANNCGYLDPSTGNKKPLYYHFKMMADNFKGNYAGCTSNLLSVKTFGCKNLQETCVLIMNEDSAKSFNYTVRLNTAAITGLDPLKINVDAGMAIEYRGTIPDQASVMLAFDPFGKLIRKCEYFLGGQADANLPPVCTTYSATATAVTETTPENNFSINVFPNPSSGKFTIELDKEGLEEDMFEIQVLNMLGQVVYSEKSSFTDGKQETELPEGITPGIYIVQVAGKKNVITRKLTIDR